jgi:hypothetical protein
MHASHAIHFAFLCILSLLYISLHVSPLTTATHSNFLTCLLLFSGLAACVPGPIDRSDGRAPSDYSTGFGSSSRLHT